MSELRQQLDLHGYAIVPQLLDSAEVHGLGEMISRVPFTSAVRERSAVYAIRNVLHQSPEIAAFAKVGPVATVAESAIGAGAKPVRGTLFDKVPEANWLVPWHQDLTICVQKRMNVPEFGPWSTKAGLPHVQPPVTVLKSMVAIRLHLDDCSADNGALRVLPGTHRLGRIMADDIARLQTQIQATTCSVPRGGALIMKPLLLHASSPAEVPSRRRVLHLEYTTQELPSGLRWLVA